MSSLGNQWRVIRHYLSLNNLNSELEKLVQKLKPATPEQWESLLNKIENAVSTKLRDTQKATAHNVLKATAVEGTETVTKEVPSIEKTKEKDVTQNETTKPESRPVGSDISFESILQGLKLTKDLHFGKISEPSWKSNKPKVSKTSIHSRTAYVVSALVAAEGECLRHRAEALVEHLLQYPEARDYAIKEGAIRALLRVQHRLRGDDEATAHVRGVVTEALSLVGHARPAGGRGPRVLALDGGGVRGLVAVTLLRRLQEAAERPVADLFDLVVGVSTGAIIAAILGSGRDLAAAADMYLTLAEQTFRTSRLEGASRLLWSHAYYDSAAWERLLRESLGDFTLSQCGRRGTRLAIVSCVGVGGGDKLEPFLFRSYECPRRTRSAYPGTANAALWQAVRASAAAPTYFHEPLVADRLHQDGGIVVNNPAGVALHEARLIFGPEAANATLVSIGTGRLPSVQANSGTAQEQKTTSWRDKFNRILDSATDTQGVHLMLHDLMPGGSYFRLNPPLLAECPMDETDPAKLQQLVNDADLYARRNRHKLQEAAQRLTAPRSIVQRAADFVRHRALLLGVGDAS